MHLVEIPLNKFRYRFRRLSWVESSRIAFPAGEDQRLIVLSHALHDVSGLPVNSVEDARRILGNLPEPVRWRVWVLYQGLLPVDLKFEFAGGLYSAPEPNNYNRQLIDHGDTPDESGPEDSAGITGSPEDRATQHAILRDAQRSGHLIPRQAEEAAHHG